MATFFRVSNRCHDGLLFMGKLASHWGGAPLTIDCAAGKEISSGYLEQVVSALREAGLVEGKRGPGGGYKLARDPKTISVREVVEALEGKIALVDCQAGSCCQEKGCGSMAIWNKLQVKVSDTLGAVSLADIAG
jgi:Rrf2 family protein